MTTALSRADTFCTTYDLRLPILMAPMAGACPPSLASAVARAGGMAACGALLMEPDDIAEWVRTVRTSSNGAFQLNTWIPDPTPHRDPVHEAAVRSFLGQWGPDVPEAAGDGAMPDFMAQCEAMIAAGPPVMSSIMGLYPDAVIARMKDRNIKWFATVTTVGEALAAEAAGADVIIAQGMEAGGHRGAFEAGDAASALIGLFALVPAVVDAVRVPVVATGGIADARGVAAALLLGASAVQIGTGLLRSPEAQTHETWADAIGAARPEGTVATRAFSGRLGRSIRTSYTDAANHPDAPAPAPYPIQRNLTGPMRKAASETSSIGTMQAWAGQSAGLARAAPVEHILTDMWEGAKALLGDG